MEIRVVPFDHPDAVKLIDLVQQEYVTRYGDPDVTPVDPAQFSPPHGIFLVGYRDGVPVACGGWRAHDGPVPTFRPGDAELKRMFVVDTERGNGFARAMLAQLERTALAAGRRRAVLETGTEQPEAIALYRSSGYTDIPGFGVYKDEPESVYLAKELKES
ncbi:GNAT family N-acetyltransferase [Prauserella sp. PE36]|uniref:GNAT family N-acetyltransferase n=1 Tax=Prauserella endophytica TaxID=1592324 RepID=A0ABY2S7R2_9PSEU|nr:MULTISPECIES: GNAT family N-acetyltransferase [Prauserella]PXY26231.1 acetyltransferase [Prauserella coralliicola]RBM20195.1 GNAT family N-acetyltransferase [Prauserella sp. PE36]TKG71964.1 GNAT family N-acetyltransferase [Prauserella endophytica]